MSGNGISVDKALDEYRKQVLRWNDQINLVSRKDTSNRLGGLIQQCRNGWNRLVAAEISDLAEASRIWYFDLGSGAGLPGIVWHIQMAATDLSVRTLLVEPREKRAWFLERVARQVGGEFPQVAANRWGDAGADDLNAESLEPLPSHILISLKALHLPDSAVLKGLEPYLGVCSDANPDANSEAMEGFDSSPKDEISLLIARFYPPDQIWSEELANELDILPEGQSHPASFCQFLSEGGSVLQPTTLPGAGLVLSRYKIRVR
ncbi:MAG: class I SAM-dependent methyltransferase [Candidatus Krumholzibacteria bacterium]|nr:class I SAM-dependent methyltransferase [Candidatus Krumholzibacteria bacterium]